MREGLDRRSFELDAAQAARIIFESIKQELKGGSCSVMLTGGRSAEALYRVWEESSDSPATLGNVSFYFGDERCVSPNHHESNFGMARRTLFSSDTQSRAQVYRMEADATDVGAAADQYGALLPEAIDVLLLSMGEDGHIASLFPYSSALHETRRRVVPITCHKPPYKRMTITPCVIHAARQVFVLAFGEKKRTMYELAICDPKNIDVIPARLALNRNWIFGEL